jgi:uncharacterized protein (DUF58 family)
MLATRARADLLALALASLLLRGGERVRLIGFGGIPGHHALDRLAEQLARTDESGRLPDAPIPRHARVVLISDFLAPLADIETMVAGLAGVPVSGHLLQILDPAEADLPYQGRIRFRGLEQESDTLVPRVEGIRTAYGEALAHQIQGLNALCAAAGFTSALHRTDQPPEAALLGLYTALAPR